MTRSPDLGRGTPHYGLSRQSIRSGFANAQSDKQFSITNQSPTAEQRTNPVTALAPRPFLVPEPRGRLVASSPGLESPAIRSAPSRISTPPCATAPNQARARFKLTKTEDLSSARERALWRRAEQLCEAQPSTSNRADSA